MNTNKLRLIMRERKMTRKALTLATGLSGVTIDRILDGGDVRISTLETLASALGVTASSLLEPLEVTDDDAAHIATVSGHHNTTAVDATIHTGDVERLATLEQLVDTQQRYIRLLEQQLAGAAVRAPNAPH